tara:strand:+ start:1567 stop:1764 length:198 start_codon:yes stop_codon:yes gene_type:complete
MGFYVELRKRANGKQFWKEAAFVFCCLTFLQGCEKSNNLILGTLAVGGLMILQDALSENQTTNTE